MTSTLYRRVSGARDATKLGSAQTGVKERCRFVFLPDEFNRVVSFASQKGGVYKTALIANIGYLFSTADQRILLIDLDPQANLQDDLGYEEHEDNDHGLSLAAALIGNGQPKRINIRPNIDVIPGGEHIRSIMGPLAMQPEITVYALARAIKDFVGDYDLVLIDLPPGDRALRLAAFGASRYVMVPTKSDKSSIKGTLEIALDINRISRPGGENESLSLLGLTLLGSAEGSTAIKRLARDTMHMVYSEDEIPELFESTIRSMESVAQISRLVGRAYAEQAEMGLEIGRVAARNAGVLLGDVTRIAEEMLERIASIESAEQE